MRAVRSTGTGPERKLRKALLHLKVPTRTHAQDLPGTPDLVIRDLRIAIFVHGCFWHGHPNCSRGTLPATRRDFWRRKIRGNRRRDRAVAWRLRIQGFRVLTIWTCQLRSAQKSGNRAVRRVVAAVELARRASKSPRRIPGGTVPWETEATGRRVRRLRAARHRSVRAERTLHVKHL